MYLVIDYKYDGYGGVVLVSIGSLHACNTFDITIF